MGRAVLTIRTDEDRSQARLWVTKAPVGTEIEFRRDMRSDEQNKRLWASLTDVAEQVDWYGQHLSPEDWKNIFTASLRKSAVVPGIDPGTVVPLGLSTSKLTKDEFSNLIELINAFAAERGVTLHDDIARGEAA
jgi:hypothetical protein